jgi:hypothetical protein
MGTLSDDILVQNRQDAEEGRFGLSRLPALRSARYRDDDEWTFEAP